MENDSLTLIRPDPHCPICEGRGFVPGSSVNYSQECNCVYLARVQAYLGPELLGIPWNREKDVSKYIGKNLIIEDFSSEESVKSFLKTFILRTYIEYNFSYRLAAPYAVVDSYFASSITHQTLSPVEGSGRINRTDLNFIHLSSVDLLVLRCLGSDPRHGQYSSILTTLIQERALRRRVTWIFSKYRIDSSTFKDVYGTPFASFLEGEEPGFHRVRNSGTE